MTPCIHVSCICGQTEGGGYSLLMETAQNISLCPCLGGKTLSHVKTYFKSCYRLILKLRARESNARSLNGRYDEDDDEGGGLSPRLTSPPRAQQSSLMLRHPRARAGGHSARLELTECRCGFSISFKRQHRQTNKQTTKQHVTRAV